MEAKIQFFPTNLQYTESDAGVTVQIYGTTPDGKQICISDSGFEPYFYVVTKDAMVGKLSVEKNDKVYRVARTEEVAKKFLGKDIAVTKVYVNLPKAVPAIREALIKRNMTDAFFEYDIQYVRRYMIDKGLTFFTLAEAVAEQQAAKLKIPCFKASSVQHFSDDTLKPRVLAFDIETYNPLGKSMDVERNPIIMIALYSDNFQKVFTWKQYNTKLSCVEFARSEAELIEKFKEAIEAFKPDIITGYYSDNFDLPYIEARAKKYKIKLDLGLDYSELKIKKTRSITDKPRISAAVTGIVHLDMIDIVRKILGSGNSEYYSLDRAATELLDEKKLEVDLNKLSIAWESGTDDLDDFCSYNLHDARLTHMLCMKLLPQLLEMVKIVGLSIIDVGKMGFSQIVEWYLIRQAANFNELVPNKPDYSTIAERKKHTFQGAFVHEPNPGLYQNVALFDFRSLYPTIISSHNISPENIDCECCRQEQVPEGMHHFCIKRKGFIPTIIEEIIARRMRIKEMLKGKHQMLEARQETLKLLANAFYGYLGFFAARWYSIDCAESVTAYGRHYIRQVIAKAGQAGFSVLYSDTDSVFILLETHSIDEAKRFVEKLNMQLPGIMELEFEGYYQAALFVALKSSQAGAKKKYALLDGEGRVKIKGFETVRRNWSAIARGLQREVIELILRTGDPKQALEHVREVAKRLKANEVPLDKVVIHTQLQKMVEEYASVGPHVRAAMRLRQRGIPVGPGSVIKFVVARGGGRVSDRVKLADEAEDYDANYYLHNQIIPSVQRIFAVFGIKEEDIVTAGQEKLAKFL
ncbi:MAG: DNA-directed DNA polymerase [Candidatus Woesearchaeota archaeon]